MNRNEWGPDDVVEAALGDRRIEIDDDGYPRFSAGELARRRESLWELAGSAGVDGVVVNEEGWQGSAIPWLTEWHTTRQAVLVMSPGAEDRLLVQHHNHLPQARTLARRCDVAWGGPSTVETLLEELAARGVRDIGWIGRFAADTAARLADAGFAVTDLTSRYGRLRMVKSAEELDWLRVGAFLSDRAVLALQDQLAPGMSEFAIGDVIERAYVPLGATTLIHHIVSTPMAAPTAGVPRQHRSFRRVEPGDAVTVEISAEWSGHAGQVLRTLTLGPPTDQYRRMHDVAEEALAAIVAELRPGATAADLVAASGVIEAAGFTIIDDLVHGFGGGYLAPVLGTASRPAGPIPDLTLEEGMTLVVQPNVTTTDWTAGVQTGELYEVTPAGGRSLHTAPEGLLQVG